MTAHSTHRRHVVVVSHHRRAAHRVAYLHHATYRYVAVPEQRVAYEAAQRRPASLPPPDEYIGAVRVIGQRQIGEAAWYGGRDMIGHRTASGEPLDTIHITAAHRSLPLYTKVRVTNLRNGRSIIATINDRGPVSRRLLIDLSPRAAAELDMMRSGVAPVSVEPVAVSRIAAAGYR